MNAVGTTTHPAFGDNIIRYRLDPLSMDGDGQVEDTIGFMRRYALEDSSTPEIREDAQDALSIGGGDPLLGVWLLCKQRFQFTQDYATVAGLPSDFDSEKQNIVESIIRPLDLSLMYRAQLQPIEDCDGYHTYAASLLTALSVPCSFCTVAVDDREPDRYSHVYLVAYPSPSQRVPLDCSHGKFVGWEAPNPFGKRKEWPLQVSYGVYLAVGVVVLASLWLMGSGRG